MVPDNTNEMTPFDWFNAYREIDRRINKDGKGNYAAGDARLLVGNTTKNLIHHLTHMGSSSPLVVRYSHHASSRLK